MTQLRIASYNIRKAVGLDWRRDPARILRVLRDLDADIVLLQEADKRLGDRPAAIPRTMIANESPYHVVDLAPNDVSLGWHGNALLVRDGLEVDRARRIPLPGLEPRGAIEADIAGLTVVGTHLGLLRRSRKRQMQVLRDQIGERATRSIVLGDFNEWSSRKGFEPWNGTLNIVEPGRSYHSALRIGALDAIAHGDQVRVDTAGVFSEGLARRASDHLPIWANVRLLPG